MLLNPKLKPINDYILVKELRPAREGRIYIPSTSQRRHYFGTILEVGKPKDSTITPGTVCVFQHSARVKTKYGDVFKENNILMVMFRGSWIPFGYKALVERDIEEERVGRIIIPACYQTKDQSLFGTFLRAGVKDNKIIETVLEYGDQVKIYRWHESIDEISSGKKFNVIVPMELIEYRKERC